MITVTPEFSAAQLADSAQYVKYIYAILGNYASSGAGASASSNGDDASGNYPAAGAIDGDRTEINIGAASAADNGVGQSSWKSNANPSLGSPNILTVAFGQTRTFNRVKLYNLAADPLTSYVLEYSVDGSTGWTAFAGTSDVFTPPTPPAGSYGWGGPGGWGAGPWGGSTNPYNVTGGLDAFDFPDVTAKAFRLRVFATKSGGPGQVVEVEVYRKVDISDRVIGLKVDRKKDFKLSQPIATQLTLDLDNKDQFFSLFYSPTVAQSATYINAELQTLGINVEVNEGFMTYNGPETIRTFTGSVDTISNNARPGRAQLIARDFLKHLINQYDSCNLKTSIDLKDCIKYCLNRNNVSNYEMSLFSTGTVLDYFFFYEQPILTVIQEIVQAAGDAVFWYDENGIATFQYYLSATPQTTDNATLTAATQPWSFFPGSSGNTSSIVNSQLQMLAQGAIRPYATLPSTAVTGEWVFSLSSTNLANTQCTFTLIGDAIANTSYPGQPHQGYLLSLDNHNLTLVRNDNYGIGSPGILINVGSLSIPNDSQVKVNRTAGGVFKVYLNGVLIGTATDTTYNTSAVMGFANDGNASFPGTLTIYNFYYTANSTASAQETNFDLYSDVIDQTAAISAESTLTADYTPVGGTTITFYTATSSDGVSWDPWVAVTPGSVIGSTAKRYIKWRVEATGTNNYQTVVRSVTVSWLTGNGQQKWSTNVNFNVTTVNRLKDLQAQTSDALGGVTAIVNDIAVTSSPLVLGSSQTMWQATAGTPAAPLSASNALNLAPGTYTYNVSISGGMDTSQMSGTNPAAIQLTNTAAGVTVTSSISYIHPTKPIIKLVVSGGTAVLTQFQLVGKAFGNATTPYQALASDAASIQRHRRRHQDVNNNYIVSNSVAGVIASRVISNFKAPVTWLPKVEVCPPLVNVQTGDQISLTEGQTGLSGGNYYVIGITREVRASARGASFSQALALLPVG